MDENDYRNLILTHSEAMYQLEQHGVIRFTEFYADLGERITYTGDEVLNWLGY